MTELEKFNQVWKFEGQRGKKTQAKYEDILFSIWKNHPNWDTAEGFQISIKKNNPESRTIYRVIEQAEKAGILICIKKYLVGEFNRAYNKNHLLFNLVFRGADNKYKKWLDTNTENDILGKADLTSNITDKNIHLTSTVTPPRKRKFAKLNYDINKLYNISSGMFCHYFSLLQTLNSKAIHNDLKFRTFIYFDKDGLPTGRPYSYFCSTLNPEKDHIDNSTENRPDFLQRVGLGDYYEVYDIKAEYPRVNYLFHTGIWKEDDYDFYAEIIKDTEMLKYTGEAIPRSTTKYTPYEDSMKQIFMRIFFGKGTDWQGWNGYVRDRLKREGIIKIKKKKVTIIDQAKYDWFFRMLENGEDINFDIWKIVSASTDKICGKSIGVLINWFSFFIESEVKIELLNRGKMVYNVYDGFYYNEDIQGEIKDLLAEKAMFVYHQYMKPIRLFFK